MVHCDADAFLNELHKLFERNKAAGSVWITMKRSDQRPRLRARAKAGAPPPVTELRCLLRATDGKRKISTSLGAAEYAKFQASYALILRAQMDALKKRGKAKKEPGKASKGAAAGSRK
jgi:signal recognition particle subunit SRP14